MEDSASMQKWSITESSQLVLVIDFRPQLANNGVKYGTTSLSCFKLWVGIRLMLHMLGDMIEGDREQQGAITETHLYYFEILRHMSDFMNLVVNGHWTRHTLCVTSASKQLCDYKMTLLLSSSSSLLSLSSLKHWQYSRLF